MSSSAASLALSPMSAGAALTLEVPAAGSGVGSPGADVWPVAGGSSDLSDHVPSRRGGVSCPAYWDDVY